jgi:hypothetical protein
MSCLGVRRSFRGFAAFGALGGSFSEALCWHQPRVACCLADLFTAASACMTCTCCGFLRHALCLRHVLCTWCFSPCEPFRALLRCLLGYTLAYCLLCVDTVLACGFQQAVLWLYCLLCVCLASWFVVSQLEVAPQVVFAATGRQGCSGQGASLCNSQCSLFPRLRSACRQCVAQHGKSASMALFLVYRSLMESPCLLYLVSCVFATAHIE